MKKSQKVFWGAVALIIAISGVDFLLSFFNFKTEKDLAFYNGSKREFTAIVSQERQIDAQKQKLTATPTEFRGKVLLNTGLYPQYDYGDQLKIVCQLQEPKPVENFAYDKYLAKDGIYSLCYQPQITLLSQDQGNFFIATILHLKKSIIDKINQVLVEPQASLLSGILLGSRDGISQKVKDDFNSAGITHIIAISGYNISIIVALLLNSAKHLRIRRKQATIIILFFLLAFVVMTGASASVVRASIMGLLVLLARHYGRQNKMANALVLTAGVMVACNPKILFYDAGFQLSFLATVGLVYLSPLLQPRLKFLPETFSLRENMSTTLSAIIMTLPLMLMQFGRLSIVAPLVNLLVLPVIPLTMLIGFLMVIGAFVLPFLGAMISWFVWLLLFYVIKIAHFFAGLPIAGVPLKISFGAMLILYFLIILIMQRRSSLDRISAVR